MTKGYKEEKLTDLISVTPVTYEASRFIPVLHGI